MRITGGCTPEVAPWVASRICGAGHARVAARDAAQRDRLAVGLPQVPRDERGAGGVDLHGRRLAGAGQPGELRRRGRGQEQEGGEQEQQETAHRRMVAAPRHGANSVPSLVHVD